jgi:tripartite-type tricarboxylate transporter receptor subunit TctC
VSLVLLVNPRLPAEDRRGLIALLRREPGRYSYDSADQGSAIHVAAELFRRMAQVEIVHVPYRGAAPALQDVIAGNIQMMFDSIATTPHLAAGVVRALAVMGYSLVEDAQQGDPKGAPATARPLMHPNGRWGQQLRKVLMS